MNDADFRIEHVLGDKGDDGNWFFSGFLLTQRSRSHSSSIISIVFIKDLLCIAICQVRILKSLFPPFLLELYKMLIAPIWEGKVAAIMVGELN